MLRHQSFWHKKLRKWLQNSIKRHFKLSFQTKEREREGGGGGIERNITRQKIMLRHQSLLAQETQKMVKNKVLCF